MPTVSPAPLSGRYLSFAEREEIAILHAQQLRGARDRPPHRPFSVDDLAGAAPQRRDPQRYGWSIGRRPRSGTPSGGPAARRSRKLAANDALRDYVQDRLAGTIDRARR